MTTADRLFDVHAAVGLRLRGLELNLLGIANNISIGIHPLRGRGGVELLNLVVGVRNKQLKGLHCHVGWVVSCNNYVSRLVVVDGTIGISSILTLAPLPAVRANACTCSQVSNQTRIARLRILNTLKHNSIVVF